MQLPNSLRTLQATHRPLPGFETFGQAAAYTVARVVMPQAKVSVAPAVAPAGAVVAAQYQPSPIWAMLSAVSAGASAFHGYRRNQSVGWAVAWGAAGAAFPIITPAIAIAQGFGKRAKR